jgi:hypothetical protein
VPATPRGVRFKRDGARGRGWKRSPDAHDGDYDRTPASRSRSGRVLGRDSKVGDEAISLSQNIEGDFSAEARESIEVSASDLGQIIEHCNLRLGSPRMRAASSASAATPRA